MPTDYGVTSTKFGYVTLRKDVICPRRFEKKSRYVTQRHHMPTSILKKSLRYATCSIYYFFICCIYASVQSLRGFMNLKREQLALAANLWWPTFAKGTAAAAEDSITSKSLDVSKSLDISTSLSSPELIEVLPVLRGT